MDEGLIRNTPDLKEACDALVAGGVAALDTEFVWRASYRPHLAIVQMAGADGVCRALDCQLGTDPSPFAAVLSDPSVVKILHAAHQDLELMYHYASAAPVNVFDTQLAAGFCGHSSNMGLQKLLYEVLDVGLAKTETCTDWSQRPLTDAQVRYALDDVRYLVSLRAALLAQCDAFGTRAWLEEDLLKYESPDAYGDMEPDEMWKRVKGNARRLPRRGLAGLRALASVRERRAIEWNLPRGWLGDDASLVDLAWRLQHGETTFPNVRFRHRLKNNAQRDHLAADYAAALMEAAGLSEEDWPFPIQPDYPAEVLDAADKAYEYLVARGKELHVDPAVFANRAQLLAFVDDPEVPDNPLAEGWRFDVVGRTIIERFYVP